MVKELSVLSSFILIFFLTTFSGFKISKLNNKNILLTQDCTPARCCSYNGVLYPVGTIIGPYICRPDGSWGRRS